jgi:hypothetical protein
LPEKRRNGIDVALYAYRISVQDSTRYSPFLLLYNRHPRKAIDFELATATSSALVSKDNAEEAIDDKMERLLSTKKEYHDKAIRNIKLHRSDKRTTMMLNMIAIM